MWGLLHNLYERSICGHPFSRPLLAASQHDQIDRDSYYMKGKAWTSIDALVMLVHFIVSELTGFGPVIPTAGWGKVYTASRACMCRLDVKTNAQGWSGVDILGVYHNNFVFGEVECTTCMGGAFVDTHFHAHRSRHRNMTKQPGIPIIWRESMNEYWYFSNVSTFHCIGIVGFDLVIPTAGWEKSIRLPELVCADLMLK